MFDCTDTYQELMMIEMGVGHATDKEITRQDVERKRELYQIKRKRHQDMTYFEKLTQHIQLFTTPNRDEITKLKIDRFPLLISNIDAVLKALPVPILELQLNSTFVTASECNILSENPQFQFLRSLDLSCNPVTIKGLMNLIDPKTSQFTEKLKFLKLFNCDIDFTQSNLISNDQLQNTKCQFNLKYLNLSYNNLGSFLKFVCQFELINSDLQSLLLSDCQLKDEHLIDMVSAKEG